MTSPNSALKGQKTEELARGLRAAFERASYDAVTAPVLQPADIFLDMSGEDIRRRMYVFADPGGEELCLRPELTIPVCRLYLEQGGNGERRLCSVGPVYRYEGAEAAERREFTQAGVECLGVADVEAADAEVIALAARAMGEAGLQSYDIAMGDLALFDALIEALAIPPGWRARLKRHFWRPAYFQALLERLATGDGAEEGGERQALISAIAGFDDNRAREVIEDVLKLAGIAPVGGRTLEEVAERLLEQAELAASSVSAETVALISDFLAIEGPLSDGLARIKDLAKKGGISLGDSIARFERRIGLIEQAGLDLARARFATGFGRNMTYYTGFVFEFRVASIDAGRAIVGGGRYDRLLQTLGASSPVPAIGCAVHVERLAAALAGGAK